MLFLPIIVCMSCTPDREIDTYPDGQLNFEVRLVDGKREGVSKKYYETGEIQLISHWKEGNKEGESIQYYKNGNIQYKANYKNGKLTGWQYEYDSAGNLFKKIYTLNGVVNGDLMEYYPNGNLKFKAKAKNGIRNGWGYKYYKDGDLFMKFYFKEDSIYYLKGFNENGDLYYSKLPLNTMYLPEQRVVKLKQLFAEFDSARIDVLIGSLNEKNKLVDTTALLKSSNLSIGIPVDTSNEEIEGIVKEIKIPSETMEGWQYFRE